MVLDAVPQAVVLAFSKGRQQVLRSAKEYATSQGLDWEGMSAEGKFKILATAGLASRLRKHGEMSDRDVWREEAAAIGWQHRTIQEGMPHLATSAADRYDRAYAFAARHVAEEFRTAAVICRRRL